MAKPSAAKPSPPDTRDALLEAATNVFAEHGYAAGSVRLITKAAGANQAAITYHFGGKDELYRAVLREAIVAFEAQSLINETNVLELERRDALRLVIRQFLLPLTQHGRLGRYVRIFGREGVEPSPVYEAFVAEEPLRMFAIVELLVRRFFPDTASRRQIALAAFWLIQQPIAFVHNAGRLAKQPYGMTFDTAETEFLVEMLTDLSVGGLELRGAAGARRDP